MTPPSAIDIADALDVAASELSLALRAVERGHLTQRERERLSHRARNVLFGLQAILGRLEVADGNGKRV